MIQHKRKRVFHAVRQQGMTLIEIMVAVVISMLLSLGVVQIFINSKETYRFQEALSRVQESGRYALQAISQDLRMVGYNGCGGKNVLEAGMFTNTLNTSGSFSWNFGEGLIGNEASGGSWTPALDASIIDPEPDNDALTIRVPDPRTNTNVIRHPGRPNDEPGSANIQVPQDNGFQEGDILFVSTCEAAAVFQVVGGNPDGSGTIPHGTGGGTPGNSQTGLGRRMTNGHVMKMKMRSYYIRQGANGQPSLWVVENNGNPQEMVENVEAMQVVYGVSFDDKEPFIIDEYVTADAVADWNLVRSVRVSLLLASTEGNVTEGQQPYTFDGQTVTPTDGRLRQVMTTTVALRNRLK